MRLRYEQVIGSEYVKRYEIIMEEYLLENSWSSASKDDITRGIVTVDIWRPSSLMS